MVRNTSRRAKGGERDMSSSTRTASQHSLTEYVRVEAGALGEYEITEKPTVEDEEEEEEVGSPPGGYPAPPGAPPVGVPQPDMEYPESLPPAAGGSGGGINFRGEVKRIANMAKSVLQDHPPKPILIAVMGKTGTGKTSFINAVTGGSLTVGHGLDACTQDVQMSSVELRGRQVTFIDTPGFDDTNRSDVDILRVIASCLEVASSAGVKLSGVIYLHRIIDPRMEGSHMKNIRMFRKLCGDKNFGNVILCTTMWEKVTPDEGARRERQLCEASTFWGDMIQAGANVRRHVGPDLRASAEDIAWELVGKSTVVLQLQEELESKPLSETSAGRILVGEMQEMKRQLKEEMQQLKAELKESGNTKEQIAALKEYFHKEVDNLKRLNMELEKMRDEDRKAYQRQIDQLQAKLDGGSGSCAIC